MLHMFILVVVGVLTFMVLVECVEGELLINVTLSYSN